MGLNINDITDPVKRARIMRLVNESLGAGGAETRRRVMAAVNHAEQSASETHSAGPTYRPARPSYSPAIVSAYFQETKIPPAEFEFRFAPNRRWRFDLAWPAHKLAIEVQGGIWTQGRHTRGAALVKEYEKLNAAAALGWRLLFILPDKLCTRETVSLILICLGT